MSAAPKKYIFVNGVMKLNPEFNKSVGQQSAQAHASQAIAPLAIMSCPADFVAANEAQQSSGSSTEIQLPQSAINAIGVMQGESYLAHYTVAPERNLFEELCEHFVVHEVPIGLISKLLVLQNYRLNFMVDDSGNSSFHFSFNNGLGVGSMGSDTDV
jgi:hypothetical protein